MQGIVRLGDRLTSGGYVRTASSNVIIHGVTAAQVGDEVDCPIEGHGVNQIVEGNSRIRDRGVPLVFDNHQCACGCYVISSMPNVQAI